MVRLSPLKIFMRKLPPKFIRIVCKIEKALTSPILAPLVALFLGVSLVPAKHSYFLKGFGYKLLIPRDSFLLAIKILMGGSYEEAYSLGEGDAVIDVGAHVGIFSIKAARKVRERTCYSYRT